MIVREWERTCLVTHKGLHCRRYINQLSRSRNSHVAHQLHCESQNHPTMSWWSNHQTNNIICNQWYTKRKTCRYLIHGLLHREWIKAYELPCLTMVSFGSRTTFRAPERERAKSYNKHFQETVATETNWLPQDEFVDFLSDQASLIDIISDSPPDY